MAKILTYNNCLKNILKEELYLPCLDVVVYQKVAKLIVIKRKISDNHIQNLITTLRIYFH